MGFQLRNCSDSNQIIITDTDLIAYVGKIITTEEFPNICFEVLEEEVIGTGAVITIVNCYPSCSECLRVAYQLTDCTGRLLPKYSVQPEFEDLVGQIIKVPYYDNSCFTISEIQYSNVDYEYETFQYSKAYATCSACRQLRTVEPEYTTMACDTDYVDKVKRTFSGILYNQILQSRYGVSSCCQEDYTKWYIKSKILDYELKKHLSPDLPEPIVEACCIDKFGTTCNTDCNCSSQTISCTCQSQNSCGCLTYTFNVVAGMLADAIGNTDTTKNNKVYLRYKPCGEKGRVTINYTAAGKQEQCVEGTPELYWLKNDQEVAFDSIEGGNLKKCQPCQPLNCPCKCTASECSPHDCHTYTFSVVEEMLADAIGNTETSLNNKVFFGYIPCAKTCSVTENYTTVGSQEYCVLGTPILGWYKEDVWTDYDSIPEGNLTRGAVCEVDNDCDGCSSTSCDKCNTCK